MKFNDLQLYGLAIAATNTHQRVWNVGWTTIGVTDNDHTHFDIIPQHTLKHEPLDTRRIGQVADRLELVTNSIHSMVGKQRENLKDHGFRYAQVPLIVGRDGRELTVNQGIKRNCNARDFERALFGEDGISRLIAYRPSLRKTYLKLSDCLRKCHLQWGSYNDDGTDKIFDISWQEQAVNGALLHAVPRFLANPADVDALGILKGLARQHARYSVRSNTSCFQIDAKWKELTPEVKKKYPSLWYRSLHEDIEAEFSKTYQAEMGEHMDVTFNVQMREAYAERHPFFTDPLAAMIWDIFDYLAGLRTYKDITPRKRDERFWREETAANSRLYAGRI